MNVRIFFGNLDAFRALRAQVFTAFQQHPKIANSCTGFVTFAAGDLLAQKLQPKDPLQSRSQVDFSRSLKVGLLGVFMNGVCLHYWYRFLDRWLGNSMKSKVGIFLKVISDQLVYAPFSILTFFAAASLQETKTLRDFSDNLQDKVATNFLHTLGADCTLWPLINFINFRFIPITFRPSFVAIAQLVWQTYLSTVSRLQGKNVITSLKAEEGITLEEDASCSNAESTAILTDAVLITVPGST